MKKLETWFENRLFIALNIAIEDFCAKSATNMISPFEGHRFVFKQNNGHFLILNLHSY